MKKFFKWTAIILISLIGVIVLALAVIYAVSIVLLNHTYEIAGTPLTISSDADTLVEGKRQFTTRGCADCHGADGAGKLVVDDPFIGTVMATNLTNGKGGIGATYQNSDWERTIRHGVKPNGKPLFIMPSQEYYPTSDSDLAALVAYVKSLAPVDHTPQPITVGPISRILHATGMFPLVPAEVIDHSVPRPREVAKGKTKEYGEYLANTCTGCHGAGLSGGPIPGIPAQPPYPANLTADVATGLGTWQEADFVSALRTGMRPDGTQIATAMPWQTFKTMTDDELGALGSICNRYRARLREIDRRNY